MSNKRKAVPITRSQKKAKTRSTLWKLQPKPEPTFDSFWTMLRGNEGMQESFYSGLRDPISFTVKAGDWIAQETSTPNLYDIYKINFTGFAEDEMTYTYEDLAAPRSRFVKIPVLKRGVYPAGTKQFSVSFDGGATLHVRAFRPSSDDLGIDLPAVVQECENNVLINNAWVWNIHIRVV